MQQAGQTVDHENRGREQQRLPYPPLSQDIRHVGLPDRTSDWDTRAVPAFVTNLHHPCIVAVIPAYNEDRFIGSVILKSRSRVDKVIVVDDGSSDQTATVASEAGAQVIRHPTNRGKGTALRTGFAAALDRGADVVVTFDADGQHDPRQISAVIAPILTGEADLVIGSRFKEVKNRIPAWRQLGQHALTLATNVAAGVSASDSQSGFRAFNRDMLSNVQWQSDGFAVECEMQFWAREHHLRIQEVAISCVYVEKPKRNPMVQALQVLNGLLQLTSETRPLMFFGLVGLFATLSGIGWGWWIVRHALRTGDLNLVFALAATIMIILGTLAAFEGITLHALRKIMVRTISGLAKPHPAPTSPDPVSRGEAPD